MNTLPDSTPVSPHGMTIAQILVMREVLQDLVLQITLDNHTPGEGLQEVLKRAKAVLTLSSKD